MMDSKTIKKLNRDFFWRITFRGIVHDILCLNIWEAFHPGRINRKKYPIPTKEQIDELLGRGVHHYIDSGGEHPGQDFNEINTHERKQTKTRNT